MMIEYQVTLINKGGGRQVIKVNGSNVDEVRAIVEPQLNEDVDIMSIIGETGKGKQNVPEQSDN